MGWIGKLVGGTIGFALGGPLGAIAGAAFGHAFDKSHYDVEPERAIRQRPGQEAQFTFFVAAFSMLAKLAKADGRITQGEIDTINRFMLQLNHPTLLMSLPPSFMGNSMLSRKSWNS